MSQHYHPRPYQTQIMSHILENPRCGVWADMGLGKTVATLSAIDGLLLLGEIDFDSPVLVLAPKRVAISTWPDEVRKWRHLSHLTVVPITGGVHERTAALKKPAYIYTTNYENLPWLIDQLGDAWPFATVICDESTKLKGFRLRQGAQRARVLGKIAHTKIKRLVELTGTPSPNGLQDLWGQMWFLDAGERLGRSFQAFTDRWFKTGHDGYSLIALPHAQGEIQDRLRDVCIRVDANDHFDIEQPIINRIYLELPPGARKLYREMEKEMFMALDGHEIEAFSAAARTMKCLQIANGAAYIDESHAWKEIHDIKLQALEEIIEEAVGASLLVAYHFKSDLARLQAAFPVGRVLDADPDTIRAWNAGEIPLLFAHPASAGHGLNLQDGGHRLVFFSVNWNLEEHQQIIERIGPIRQCQAGHQRPVYIHYLLARNTVDELVMERLETKKEVQDILLSAMKRRQQQH
jgi:SNF2 family DNA or RNA helicase